MLERNKKKLHRVANNHSSDWDGLEHSEMNQWQRIAARSQGLATIGNALTLSGFAFVVAGLFSIANNHIGTSILLIGGGRMLDYFDGILADMTHTKSRLGASLDEVADAVGLGLTLIVLLTHHVVPAVLLILVALPKTINALSWCIAKVRQKRMDTTAQSKVATFIIWAGLLLYVLYRAADLPVDTLFMASGWALTILGAALSLPSSYVYLRGSLKQI